MRRLRLQSHRKPVNQKLITEQMVTVEVELKEGDEEPEQHLDDGEHIERVVVPISELYEKLQGKLTLRFSKPLQEMVTSPFLAISKEPDKIVDAR